MTLRSKMKNSEAKKFLQRTNADTARRKLSGRLISENSVEIPNLYPFRSICPKLHLSRRPRLIMPHMNWKEDEIQFKATRTTVRCKIFIVPK